MLFSDNVARSRTRSSKTYAREHDLLVMGPDCGTAILSGIPLGFAGAVRRGDIDAVRPPAPGCSR